MTLYIGTISRNQLSVEKIFVIRVHKICVYNLKNKKVHKTVDFGGKYVIILEIFKIKLVSICLEFHKIRSSVVNSSIFKLHKNICFNLQGCKYVKWLRKLMNHSTALIIPSLQLYYNQ